MAGLPSIKVDQSDLPASSSSRSPPWNPFDASTNERPVPLPDSTLSPPQLKAGASVVGDYGDTKHLEHPNRFTPQPSALPTADDALVQFGANFSETSDVRGLGPWDTRSTGGDSISLQSNADSSSTLSELIRERVQYANSAEDRTFYPISDLEEVVTRRRARQELGNIPDVDAILDQIFLPRPVLNHKTRVFKIFVILTLMGKPEAVRDFIRDEIYDLDLPFERPPAEGTLKNRDQYIRNPQIQGRVRSEIAIFKRWAAPDIESFVEKQHAVCVPIFDFDTQPGAPAHYTLRPQTILPYIENEEHVSRSEGHSDVWKVKIHPAHIICHKFGTNVSLAVKQLKNRTSKSFTEESEKFIKEARNLGRFASRDHDFIIKLLCTFQWRNHYYLLFPWADGNLVDLWSRHPHPLAPLKQPSTARWLSAQCLGLARALRDIHHGDAHSTLHLAAKQRKHGKHGDIKPANILYFKAGSKDDDTTYGACQCHLKMSDLGEAEFHSTTSVEVAADGLKYTPSYSAPELRVKNVSVPHYDIFSLACVLLEFVTWYLHGFDGVEKFHEKRVKEPEEPVLNFHGDFKDFKVDSFFKHVTVRMDGSRHIGAMHKNSVTEEIDRLLEDQYCSDYILDLLVFIRDHLLRMNPKNRATCDTIYKRFQELDRQCREDDTYCVEKLKQPPTRSRTDTSLITEIEITGEHKLKIVTDSRVGPSGHVHIKVEERVNIQPGTHPPSGGGSVSELSAPVNSSATSKTLLTSELARIGEVQMGQEGTGKQECVTCQHNTAEAKYTGEDTSNKQDTLPPVKPSQSVKPSDGTRHIDLLRIPSKRRAASSSRGSNYPVEDASSSSENEGQSSTRSAKRLFRRTPFEKDRGGRGFHGIKINVSGFLRKVFSWTPRVRRKKGRV